MLTGADPATVFRLIAQESLKLMDAAATLVAVPGDSERPSAEVDEFVVTVHTS